MLMLYHYRIRPFAHTTALRVCVEQRNDCLCIVNELSGDKKHTISSQTMPEQKETRQPNTWRKCVRNVEIDVMMIICGKNRNDVNWKQIAESPHSFPHVCTWWRMSERTEPTHHWSSHEMTWCWHEKSREEVKSIKKRIADFSDK